MAAVKCDVEYTQLENDYGREIDGVVVTCEDCGHSEESFGHGEASVKRCLALMRENCPEGCDNFYMVD